MYYKERYEDIMKILREKNGASVHFLAEQINVSEPTIRRDLAELEKEKRIKRTFGGAVINDVEISEVPMMLRENESRHPKEVIAQKALQHIRDGQLIFLDASTTASRLIKYLPNYSDITVITNSPTNSLELARLHIKSYSTGGFLLENSLAYAGKHAEGFVRNFNADVFFFSSRGLSLDGMITDASIDQSELRRVMMAHARKNIFLCTGEKIGTTYSYNLCSAADVDEIICDVDIPEFRM